MACAYKADSVVRVLLVLSCLTLSLIQATSPAITNGIGLSIPLSGKLEQCGRSALEQATNWVAIRKR
jgi:hypothetical protein